MSIRDLRSIIEDPDAGEAQVIAAELALSDLMATQPERDYAASRCIDAWHDLGTERGIGMALGPIPVTAIYAWCEVEGFDRESTRIMKNVIRQRDNDRAEALAAKQRLDAMMGSKGR